MHGIAFFDCHMVNKISQSENKHKDNNKTISAKYNFGGGFGLSSRLGFQ